MVARIRRKRVELGGSLGPRSCCQLDRIDILGDQVVDPLALTEARKRVANQGRGEHPEITINASESSIDLGVVCRLEERAVEVENKPNLLEFDSADPTDPTFQAASVL